jgi:large conductance mechanosensitive channel
MKIINEFKQFAIKGNVVDMSVGIMVGTAFTGMVNSLVKDMIMPPIALLTGGLDFSDKTIILRQATEDLSAITINYGLFINALISFFIISLVIFILIKQINSLRKKEEVQATKQQISKEVEILTEIRDLLKK